MNENTKFYAFLFSLTATCVLAFYLGQYIVLELGVWN